MKIIVIGATGTIGSAVVNALRPRHQVLAASRSSSPAVDIEDASSVDAFFRLVDGADAVVSCAGSAAFRAVTELTDEDFALSLRNKLMGQVNVARLAFRYLNEGGSITLTSGVLAQRPTHGSAAISLVNAGLEGFARAAALEAPRGVRVNVVSPPWVTETLRRLNMDPSQGMDATDVAKAYVAAVEGDFRGEVLNPADFV